MLVMTKKNKYYNRSRITEKKFREVLKYFCADLTATQIAYFTRLNVNTINKILHLLRQRMFELSQLQSAPLAGQIAVDESDFDAPHVRDKRVQGASGKTIVFGLLKRGDKIHTQIIEKCDRTIIHAIIRERTGSDDMLHSDGWRGYHGLVDFGKKKHYRVHHDKSEFARGNSHIDKVESFWGYAKMRLSKFKGMNKNMFELHLKECEFRFNNRGQNLYKILLQTCRKEPIN